MNEGLDAVDAMPVGTGRFTAGLLAMGTNAGAFAEVEHRATAGLSLYGRASVTTSMLEVPTWGALEARAEAGLRWRF